MQNSIANSVKKVWKFLIKLNIYYLAYNPAILFIDTYSREIKTYIHTKTCIWILCCRSVTQSYPSLCDPMDCSTPGFPVHHHLLDLAQTHVIELVMPSNHLILCHPLLLLPSIFPSIRVFSNESALHIRSPKYWSWSFSSIISPSNEYSGLISFRID